MQEIWPWIMYVAEKNINSWLKRVGTVLTDSMASLSLFVAAVPKPIFLR